MLIERAQSREELFKVVVDETVWVADCSRGCGYFRRWEGSSEESLEVSLFTIGEWVRCYSQDAVYNKLTFIISLRPKYDT